MIYANIYTLPCMLTTNSIKFCNSAPDVCSSALGKRPSSNKPTSKSKAPTNAPGKGSPKACTSTSPTHCSTNKAKKA